MSSIKARIVFEVTPEEYLKLQQMALKEKRTVPGLCRYLVGNAVEQHSSERPCPPVTSGE